MLSRFLKFFCLAGSVLLLSGCEKINWGDGLKMADEKVGQIFNNLESSQEAGAIDFFKKNKETELPAANNLTDKQKEEIDKWLEDNDFNRYGDSKSAIYKNGTPLIDEKTGQAIERYDYILKKFPDILERIKKGK